MTYRPKVILSKDDIVVVSASKNNLSRLMYHMGDDLNYTATTKTVSLSGKTALHAASIAGNLKIVQFLLEHGAKIDSLDSRKYTYNCE